MEEEGNAPTRGKVHSQRTRSAPFRGMPDPKQVTLAKETKPIVIVPIPGLHLGVLPALSFARAISDSVTAVHITDDMEAAEKVRLYDKGVDRPPEGTADAEIALKLRFGDILIPRMETEEPLARECRHFIQCARTGQQPRSDGRDGLRVVAALEAAQRSLEASGTPQPVSSDE